MNNLISVGFGREAAFAAALLGDNVLIEISNGNGNGNGREV